MATDSPTPTTRSTSRRPLPWTTGVRGVSCAAVVSYHALLTAVPDHAEGVVEHLFVLGLALSARLGVLCFILLSGYLLGRHWMGGFETPGIWRKYWKFILRRTVRLLPPFYAVLILVVLAMAYLGLDQARHTHWDTGLPFTWQRALTTFTMTTDLLNQVPLSHQLWTVPLEYHLYLLAPFIVLCRSPRILAIASAVAVFSLVLLDPGFTAPFFVASFVAAFWTGLRRQSISIVNVRSAICIATSVIVIAAVLSPIAFFDKNLNVTERHYIVPEAVFAVMFLPWLFYRDVMGGSDLLHRIVDMRFTRWLGQISYSLYLVHGLILELTWRAVISPNIHSHLGRVVAVMLLGALMSVLAAVAVYQLIERPSERASRRIRIGRPVEPLQMSA